MTEPNDLPAQSSPNSTGSAASMRVCFLPSVDTSLKAFVSSSLLLAAYAMVSTVLFLYVLSKTHGMWFFVATLGQLVVHFYVTTEISKSSDEVERLLGYGLLREEGLVRFCGYVPRRRRLRSLGAPIRSIEEGNTALRIHLYDGSQVQLSKLSQGGRHLFKRVFESMSAGADAQALRTQYTGLAPGLLATLEYKEAPQLPRWQSWVSATLMISACAVGWQLHEVLFR